MIVRCRRPIVYVDCKIIEFPKDLHVFGGFRVLSWCCWQLQLFGCIPRLSAGLAADVHHFCGGFVKIKVCWWCYVCRCNVILSCEVLRVLSVMHCRGPSSLGKPGFMRL